MLSLRRLLPRRLLVACILDGTGERPNDFIRWGLIASDYFAIVILSWHAFTVACDNNFGLTSIHGVIHLFFRTN